MTAFNIVRFRVKPDQVESFIEAHRKLRDPFKNFGGGWLVQTGDQSFCIIGQWKSFDDIVNARPDMVALLDTFRDMLEDLGGGLGVTDPMSGEAVVTLGGKQPAKKAAKAARKSKPAKRTAPTKRKPAPAKRRAAPARKPKGAAKKTARRSGR